jgi:hypothetical protein
MAENPGYQAKTPAQQDSGPNIASGLQPVTNSGSGFNVDANALQVYSSANATYRNGPTSTLPGLPGYRGRSRANSRLSGYLNGRNPSTQLSDYIKPDKAQNRQRSESKTPHSDGSAFSPSPSPAPSNFSDDFLLNGDGSIKKKRKKGNPKRKQPKRGAAKDTGAIKPTSEQENGEKDQQLANARMARASRRSSGKVNDGKQNESGRNGENAKVKETETEETVMMNEG